MNKRPLDQMDQDINPDVEEALRRGITLPASFNARIQAAARRSVALRKMKGGARPGAGRKALGHIPTSLALDPEARAYLARKAGGKRGMSAVANRILLRAMERDRSPVR